MADKIILFIFFVFNYLYFVIVNVFVIVFVFVIVIVFVFVEVFVCVFVKTMIFVRGFRVPVAIRSAELFVKLLVVVVQQGFFIQEVDVAAHGSVRYP